MTASAHRLLTVDTRHRHEHDRPRTGLGRRSEIVEICNSEDADPGWSRRRIADVDNWCRESEQFTRFDVVDFASDDPAGWFACEVGVEPWPQVDVDVSVEMSMEPSLNGPHLTYGANAGIRTSVPSARVTTRGPDFCVAVSSVAGSLSDVPSWRARDREIAVPRWGEARWVA